MHYLIIGNSTAAVGAVEGIRKVDLRGEITIISGEKYHVYSRPLISYYLAGKVKETDIYYRPLDFYEKNNVSVLWEQMATDVDPEDKTVHIEPEGAEIPYDRLLVASGGTPVKPSFLNGNYNNAFYFHCLDDVKGIKQALGQECKRVVIVGGGLIGLKAAESVRKLGHKVTVVEAASHVLSSIMDGNSGRVVEEYLRSQGVEVFTGERVVSLMGEGMVNGVRLQSGKEIDCDLMIVAVGIKPNCEWLNSAGIAGDDGIWVDEHMRTSVEDVFAAGDVAKACELLSGQNRLVPTLPNAYQQGKIAGLNMAGCFKTYAGSMSFNSLPLFDLDIATAGDSVTDEETGEILTSSSGDFIYRRLVLRDNRLKGFVMIGDIARCGIYRELVARQVNVFHLKDKLVSGELGMLHLGEHFTWIKEVFHGINN